LQPFLEARKQPGQDLQKWKREKFDISFAKYIHRYLIAQKNRSAPISEQAFKDLHYMTNKYLELLGSEQFNAYMLNVINDKLGLQFNQ
jgi:hypothetical protein